MCYLFSLPSWDRQNFLWAETKGVDFMGVGGLDFVSLDMSVW